MTGWAKDMTAAQIEAMNVKNRAAHVKGPASQPGDKNERAPRDKAQLAENRIKSARVEAILRAGGLTEGKGMSETPPSAPTPHSGPNQPIPEGMVGPSRRRKAAQMLPRPLEWDEQVALVTWWDGWAPQHGYDYRLLFATPNGAILGGDSRLRALQMRRLKAAGFRNGVPDLFLAVPREAERGPYTTDRLILSHGLAIEMKRKGITAVPDSQRDYHALLRAQGYAVEVCSGMEAARDAILAYLGISASPD